MENRILIPLSDFVLTRADEAPLKDWEVVNDEFVDDVLNYTNFIIQPIKLGQFIACDLKGNPLEKPLRVKNYYSDFDYDLVIDLDAEKQFKEAQARVLFKGFTSSQFDELVQFKQNDSYTFLDINRFETLEDLAHLKLELTDNALT